ncbi:MAG: DNA repair protein RecN [Clostridiales bacterium]|nr:DNA repair protein RecN [Clostridiales bacterium]MCF8021191.1 DNA repair protein RecN [Clostridiales bacterium]
MIKKLEIKDFGIIEYMEENFESGFTVLTGETGAGKSIIMDALHMVLGGKAYADYVKSGKEKALIQAEFEPGELPELEKQLKELDLELEDGMLIMTRQISRTGRNVCRVNGQVLTLQLFKQIGKYLMDMHGQHEQQSLLNSSKHMEMLDRYSGKELLKHKKDVSDLYSRWLAVRRELEKIKSNKKERARQSDMYRFQIQELDDANLSPGEEDELLHEKKRLANAEKIAQLVQDSYTALYTGDNCPAAVDQMGKVIQNLQELKNLDENFASMEEAITSALYQVEESSRDLASYRDNIEFEPERLEEVENRLSQIYQLKNKYGNSVEEILKYRDSAAAELQKLDNTSFKEDELESKNNELEKEYMENAHKLTDARKKAAKKLKSAIETELNDLEMKKVILEIKIIPSEPGSQGLEDIEFLISTNPGEPPKPLNKIASGGELSRIMLAFKSVLSAVDHIPSLVFDEVDTGIGGKTLQAVAGKLKQLSKHRQTIVVTHAAPIAAIADNHFLIHKQQAKNKVDAKAYILEGDKRITELARMLSGSDDSSAVLDHARQLLEQK